jgi:methanogenic corrinoid protein MtbC1
VDDSGDQLVMAISSMDEVTALKLTDEYIEKGVGPEEILQKCRAAMDIVGAKFEANEYFVPELILAGDMLEQISARVKPLLKDLPNEEKKSGGRVLIGTVHGDLHDIGKNIVTFMLDVNGYEVVDLGIDVQPDTFIEAIKEGQPQVVGLSGFLTLAFDSMKETIEAIEAAGLRDGVKIMIGGGQVDEQVRTYTGADAFGLDAMTAVTQCKEWIGEVA